MPVSFKRLLWCVGVLSTVVCVIGCGASAAAVDAAGDAVGEGVVVDLALPDGDHAGTPDMVERSDVDPYPGLPGATAVFVHPRDGFFSQPWPFDGRRKANGALDLSDFPNPGSVALVDDYIKEAETRVDGFSPNGAIYFLFDGPLNPNAFPGPEYTAKVKSPVFLVNVTVDSDRYGQFVPVETWYWDRPEPKPGYYLVPNLLAVRPVGGFPMRPGETYACVVRREVKDASGLHLGQPEVLVKALGISSTAIFANVFALLGQWLDETQGIGRQDIAAATVFTVSDPVWQLVSGADYLREHYDIKLDGAVTKLKTGQYYDLYEGWYQAPNFQTGQAPYDSGGEILFNSKGEPVEQWMEKLPFTLSLPHGSMPAGGWPIVLYQHGTGGDRFSFTGDVAAQWAINGIAGISIDEPLHGDRYDAGSMLNIEFYSFNFTNPKGARSLFRQSALDDVAVIKLVKKLTFKVGGKAVKFNPESIGFFGHSQGGITGALTVAVEDSIKTAILSGAGGGLAYTILLRKQIDSGYDVDIKAALEAALSLQYEDELTVFHPVITLAQLLVDVTDPLNYSPWYFYPRFRKTPLNLLITEGVKDPYTPAVTTENLAVAGGVPPILPIVNDHPGFGILDLQVKKPVSQNLVLPDGTKATAALAQFAKYGHFVAFDDMTCVDMWTTLLKSSLVEGLPTIK